MIKRKEFVPLQSIKTTINISNKMKPITNKTKRIDSRNCTFSEIEAGNKSRKVANRRDAKKQIKEILIEDEKIAEEMWDEMVEGDRWYGLDFGYNDLEEEKYLANQFQN